MDDPVAYEIFWHIGSNCQYCEAEGNRLDEASRLNLCSGFEVGGLSNDQTQPFQLLGGSSPMHASGTRCMGLPVGKPKETSGAGSAHA